jgi:hypothetical protein
MLCALSFGFLVLGYVLTTYTYYIYLLHILTDMYVAVIVATRDPIG